MNCNPPSLGCSTSSEIASRRPVYPLPSKTTVEWIVPIKTLKIKIILVHKARPIMTNPTRRMQSTKPGKP